MKIFVTGACGYKGTRLVPQLLAKGWHVVALDTMWFGNYLEPHANLEVIKGDGSSHVVPIERPADFNGLVTKFLS